MRRGTRSFSSIFCLINKYPCVRNYFPVPHRVKQVRGPRKNRQREPSYPTRQDDDNDDEYRPDKGPGPLEEAMDLMP